MPYSRSFLRHQLRWLLPGGELATCNVAWALDSSIVSVSDAEVDALADKGVAYWGDLAGSYSDEMSYAGSNVYWVGVDGHIVETFERAVTPIPGDVGAHMLPHEVAIAVTLRTASASRSGRGRFYLPPVATGAVTTGGRLDASARPAIAGFSATYLSEDTGTGLFSVVASGTTGALRPVTECQVGDVFDSQRRRRDQLVEVRSTVAV